MSAMSRSLAPVIRDLVPPTGSHPIAPSALSVRPAVAAAMIRITAVEPPPPAWMNTSRRRWCAEGLLMSAMSRSLAPVIRDLVPPTGSHPVAQSALSVRPAVAAAMLRITAVELPPPAWMNTSRRRWCAEVLLMSAMSRSLAPAIRDLVPPTGSHPVAQSARSVRPAVVAAMLRITAVEPPPHVWMNTRRVGICAAMRIQKIRAICRRFALETAEFVPQPTMPIRQCAAPVA
jgi:hypothetical protein